MALDWGILYWIQAHLTCPFLDAVMPKFTLLGDAGIIWILAAVALLCTKKYRRQGAVLLLGLLCGLLVGNVCLKPARAGSMRASLCSSLRRRTTRSPRDIRCPRPSARPF